MKAAAALALVAALSLAGCATRAPEPGPAWTSGRLALRVDAPGDEVPRSVSASFELRGDAVQGELRLNSPLGTRVAEASWGPSGARLRSADGETAFTDLDELSRQALGEALPLRALPDWLAGRPWSGAGHRLRDDGFEQLGWLVDLRRLADGRLDASRPAPPTLRVRVLLDR